jgi:protoporphyrinogen oxidase
VNPLLTTRAIFEVAWARIRNAVKPPKDDSFEAWTSSRFGKTLYDLYFGPYTQKVWGMDPGLLDPRTASQRITVDSVWDLIKKTLSYQFLGAEDFKRTHSEFRRQFFYVRRGVGTLQSHLRAKIEELGGRFQFGKALAGCTFDGDRIASLEFTDGTSAGGFSHVISTIPLPLLVEMVLGARAQKVLEQNLLPFRSMAFVFVRVAKPRVSDYHWIYYPDLDIPFQRLTEFVHFDADMSPPGTTGLTLEVSCSPGDGIWEQSDQEIAGSCITRLEELGLLKQSDVLGADVVRTRHAYPLQVMSFLEKATALLDSISHVTNIVSIGRQGLFRYCNMNECMEMAIEVVPRLLAGESSIRYTRNGTWLGVGLTDRYTVSGPNA